MIVTRIQADHLIQKYQAINLLNQVLSFGSMDDLKLDEIMNNGDVFIYSTNQEVVGVLTLILKDDYQAEIAHIAVSPLYRRQGIAKTLLTFATSNKNYSFVAHGWCTPYHWNAKELFLEAGFIVDKIIHEFWSDRCNGSEDCPHYENKCICMCVVVRKRGCP